MGLSLHGTGTPAGLEECIGSTEGEIVGDLDGYGEGGSVWGRTSVGSTEGETVGICSLISDDPPPQAQQASAAVFPKFSNALPCS